MLLSHHFSVAWERLSSWGGGAPPPDNYLPPNLSFSSDFGHLILEVAFSNKNIILKHFKCNFQKRLRRHCPYPALKIGGAAIPSAPPPCSYAHDTIMLIFLKKHCTGAVQAIFWSADRPGRPFHSSPIVTVPLSNRIGTAQILPLTKNERAPPCAAGAPKARGLSVAAAQKRLRPCSSGVAAAVERVEGRRAGGEGAAVARRGD